MGRASAPALETHRRHSHLSHHSHSHHQLLKQEGMGTTNNVVNSNNSSRHQSPWKCWQHVQGGGFGLPTEPLAQW
jgi:hypothetical protein